jgi:hypothetical protein
MADTVVVNVTLSVEEPMQQRGPRKKMIRPVIIY